MIPRILILGGKGRLGGALARMWSANYHVRALARPELDVANLVALRSLLESASYDVLVNCTGLTNVDRCETAREEAEIVNARAPGVMGEAAAAKEARFIHFRYPTMFLTAQRPLPTPRKTPRVRLATMAARSSLGRALR